MTKKKIFIVLMTIVMCLIMLEFGLRAVGRTPTNMADGINEQDGESFRLKKNAYKVIKYPAYTFTVYTNEYGFRDRSSGPIELRGKPFYMFLGASDVFGNGVDYQDSFVGIFADQAQTKGLEVVNLAVGGHFFLDQERLFKKFLDTTHLKPSTVLFCVNALHIPKFDEINKNTIVRGGYPMNRDGWRITYLRLMAGNLSSAFCFFRDGIRKIQERWIMKEISSKSPEFLEAYSKDNSMRSPERVKAFEEYLSSFEAFCEQKDINLIYVLLPLSDSFRLNEMLEKIGANPDDYDVSFYDRLMSLHCEKAGRRLINLTPVLLNQFREGRELRFKLDAHFNGFANGIIGDYLIKALLEPHSAELDLFSLLGTLVKAKWAGLFAELPFGSLTF